MTLIDPQYNAVVQLEEALEQMGDDPELLQEIVDIFMEGTPELMQTAEQAIAAGDVDQVRMLAHSMKGSASNICAVAFVETARRLEFLAHDGSLEGASELLATCREQFAELQTALATVDWESVPAL
jgi:HPt (histidine-containing phosphotransfer) domain-containing protein